MKLLKQIPKRRVVYAIVSAMLLLQANAWAGSLGVGVIVGEPSGLSIKKIKTRNTAYDFALAWSTGKSDSLYLHSDYIVHKPDFIRRDFPGLPIYFGIGGQIVLQDNPGAAVRFPLGLSDRLRDIPLEGFLELVPSLNVIPASSFEVDAAAGLRFYF